MIKKVIWIKKPKCAGTSLETFFRSSGCIYYVNQKTSLQELESQDYSVICVRSGAAERQITTRKADGSYATVKPVGISEWIYRISGQGFLALDYMAKNFPDFMNQYPKFCVARNPYDKFVSSMRYLEKYRKKSPTRVLDRLPNRSQSFHDWHHLTRSQYDCIHDATGRNWIDYVLYMESDIDASFARICDYIDVDFSAIPHKNKSARGSVYDSLTSEEAGRVLAAYNHDFDYFGYSPNISIQMPIKPLPCWSL